MFRETSISVCNDRILRKQLLRWATPQTSIWVPTPGKPYTAALVSYSTSDIFARRLHRVVTTILYWFEVLVRVQRQWWRSSSVCSGSGGGPRPCAAAVVILRPVTSLGHQEGRSSPRGDKFFQLCTIVFNYA